MTVARPDAEGLRQKMNEIENSGVVAGAADSDMMP